MEKKDMEEPEIKYTYTVSMKFKSTWDRDTIFSCIVAELKEDTVEEDDWEYLEMEQEPDERYGGTNQ